jgi:hypothetical protein
MALNFPSSPTIGQVYSDLISGFSYEWDGTVWRSFSPSSTSQIKVLDDISGSFDGIETTFALTSNASPITPASSQSLIINLGGVIQDPTDDYSVSGANLIFSTPPVNGLSFSGISLGPAIPINTIPDGTVTDGSLEINNDLLVNGDAVIVGIVTATSFSGDGSNLSNIISGVGIATEGGTVGTGATVLDFRGTGISTVTVSSGIATINIEGGGGGSFSPVNYIIN